MVCEGGVDGFGGLVPGPTLHLFPGDRLKLRLVNNLPESTNLHVHGLHVSPIDRGDNVFVDVPAGGGMFDFEYQIPDDHPSGLFWYHPHFHGVANRQVQRGLAGTIIIAENLAEAEPLKGRLLERGARYPGPQVARERLLVLQQLSPAPEIALNGVVVNGQSIPTIGIRRGEQQRWRILNASAARFFNLRVVGHRLRRIAVDGNYIPNYGELPEVNVLPLGPAARAEVLITGLEAGDETSYEVRALSRRLDDTTKLLTPFFDTDLGELDEAEMVVGQDYVLLARLVIEDGPAAAADLPPAVIPTLRGPLKETPDRVIAFAPTNSLSIDGQYFEHGRVDQTVELGVTETWRIVNEHVARDGWHPFHLHVNDFDVLKTSSSAAGIDPPYYQDTIPLPPLTLIDDTGDADDPNNHEPGWVEFRSNFFHFTGRFVYHCHFLNHEDGGMMGVVEVVKLVKIEGTGFPETLVIEAGPTVEGEVNSGTTVVWANLDTEEHTVTADEIDVIDGRPLFDSGDLAHRRSFAHTFDAPGSVAYHCAKHPNEKGTILVGATKSVEIVPSLTGPVLEPMDVTIAPGTTVSWTSRVPSTQTITVIDPAVDGGARSTALDLKGQFRHTFGVEGVFNHRLAAQPGLEGKIAVAPVRRRSVSIGIHDRGFDPPMVKILAGSTVTWTNRSSAPQNITIPAPFAVNSGRLIAEEPFAEGTSLNPGQRFNYHFDVAAPPITYFSRLAMTGTIVVSEDAPVAEVEIAIGDDGFQPQRAEIGLGSSVTWINSTPDAHTVSSDRGNLFDLTLMPGQRSELISAPFTTRRAIAYFSKLAMSGTIEVV